MLYLPDVRTVTLEHPPAKGLLLAAASLMPGGADDVFGGSSTAIAPGPRRIGLFTWWCLIERRVSAWTPLIGLVVALLFGLGQSALCLYAYLLWVGATRLLDALLLLTARPAISGLYPPLIYFGQIYGALIDAYPLARPTAAPAVAGAPADAPHRPSRCSGAWPSGRGRGVRHLVATPASAVVRKSS